MKIADMHCDTISKIRESMKNGMPQELSRSSLHVDIQKMKQSGYLLQNFALFIPMSEVADPYGHALELIRVFYDEMEKNKSDIGVVKRYEDIMENKKQGKMSALMTIEEGGCCKGELSNLETFYGLGARMMTLTWNEPNELAFPNILSQERDSKGFSLFDGTKGLTQKGFAFTERMEELGMIIDVSHLSDAGFWDVANHTKRPFVASHSNARALCRHARNLTDGMIRVIAERGGVIGLNFYGCFLNECSRNYSTADRLAEHARHMINIGGSECLGLGTDFDGMDGWLEIENCSQMHKLTEALERQHFTEEQIDKILYRNVLKVYREML